MNVKRYVLGSLAVFVFIYLAEFLFHGVIMAGKYQEQIELLRPEAGSMARMPVMALGFLIMAFGFCFVFTKGYEGKGIAEGIRFGLYVAIAFGLSANLINYTVFPWPGMWVAYWTIGETIIMMMGGALIALIYKPAAAR